MNRKFPSILVFGKSMSKESQFNDLFFVYHKKSVKNTRRAYFPYKNGYFSIPVTNFFLSLLIFKDRTIHKLSEYRFAITEYVSHILLMDLYIYRFNLGKSKGVKPTKKN